MIKKLFFCWKITRKKILRTTLKNKDWTVIRRWNLYFCISEIQNTGPLKIQGLYF